MGILEALSYGLPCLVTEGTTLANDIADSNAGWGTKTSLEGIQSAIDEIVNIRADMFLKSANAVALIQSKYAWNMIAKITIGEYAELCHI